MLELANLKVSLFYRPVYTKESMLEVAVLKVSLSHMPINK